MIKTGIREMRRHLSEYIKKVEQGDEIIITKRDEPIAKLTPIAKKKGRPLDSHEDLRRLIAAKGSPLSRTIVNLREDRF